MGWAVRTSSISIILSRLPELDAISCRVRNPAESPEFAIVFAFRIDCDTFRDQMIQYSIQIVHLEIDHRFLCEREVVIILLERREDDFGVLRRGGKHVRAARLHQAEMPLVPLVQSLRLVRAYKNTAKTGNGSHAISCVECRQLCLDLTY